MSQLGRILVQVDCLDQRPLAVFRRVFALEQVALAALSATVLTLKLIQVVMVAGRVDSQLIVVGILQLLLVRVRLDGTSL